MNYLKVFKQHFMIRWEIAQNRLSHIILINVLIELVLEEAISILKGIFTLIRSFGFIIFTFFAALILPLYWIVFIPRIIGVSLYRTLRYPESYKKSSAHNKIKIVEV